MSSSDSSSLSPSSLPRPSHRSSPFSVLPPELTQLIIEYTIPPSFHTSTYRSRQSTLRSLCLVSKSFYHFARPLLFAMLRIERSSNCNDWKGIHAHGDDKLLLRELVFDDTKAKVSSNLDVVGYLGLRTLVINGSVETLDLSVISELPHLSVLRLCNIALSASTSVSLPNLHEIGLFQTRFIANQAAILNPSTLPSLRWFAYFNDSDLPSGIVEALSLLLLQLHAILLDFSSISNLTPELLEKLDPITLFDADIEDMGATIPISHLRFDIHSYLGGDLEDTRNFWLGAHFSLPLTVYFPLSASPGALNDFYTVSDCRQLLETCIERGIEVYYDDAPNAWYSNSGFSEHFIERMKEERRKKGGDV